ncbi:hypothetical protein E6O75_ATG02064 [Venturia nashicola]|uniref:Uncharacterized protein n=1 Tax=Venturia nashicola TaxID=86259 RepID=A0A4Z1PI55_9PEZI|nr:hypothetical protein E6O75_ATG02064 [Venturia nashicola]
MSLSAHQVACGSRPRQGPEGGPVVAGQREAQYWRGPEGAQYWRGPEGAQYWRARGSPVLAGQREPSTGGGQREPSTGGPEGGPVLPNTAGRDSPYPYPYPPSTLHPRDPLVPDCEPGWHPQRCLKQSHCLTSAASHIP